VAQVIYKWAEEAILVETVLHIHNITWKSFPVFKLIWSNLTVGNIQYIC